MLSFLPHILFLLSVAGIIIILGKKLPTIKNIDAEPLDIEGMAQEGFATTKLYAEPASAEDSGVAMSGYAATTSFFNDVSRSAQILLGRFLGPDKREKMFVYLEKLLRKARVILMHWENRLGKALEYFSARSARRVLKERFDQESKYKISWDDIRQAEGKFFPNKSKSDNINAAEPVLASANLEIVAQDLKSISAKESGETKVKRGRKPKSSSMKQQTIAQKPVQISPVSVVSTNSEEEDFWLSVLRQNPHNPHPYKKLGEIYMNRGEYQEAKAAFVYVLKRNPYDQETTKWLEAIKKKNTE